MADFAGSLRPSDSWTTTEIRSLTHNHMWTIRGFTSHAVRYLETSVMVGYNKDGHADQPATSASPIPFRIRVHPTGNKASNYDFSFFQVFCETIGISFRAKFSVYNSRNEEIPITVHMEKGQYRGHFEYIRRDVLLQHLSPQDELRLNLTLTVTVDAVTTCGDTLKAPEPKYQEISTDFEAFGQRGKLTDFTIELEEGILIECHKVVLAARSPVFRAMLEPHTEESRTGRVVIPDIDHDVMQELLQFIYTGNAPNLWIYALEMLAVADRFQLQGLKDMTEQHLRSSLVAESATRSLMYADMYNAPELRKDAISFIAANMSSVVTTTGWSHLVNENPPLLNEVLNALVGDQPSASTASAAPSAKRARLDG